MDEYYHNFHIPVMGTGHSADTPIRVAPFGINSVISLVDDLLLEKLRIYYTREFDLPCLRIGKNVEDGRAKRITAYLDTVQEIVSIKLEVIKKLPFFEKNDKTKYFEILPDHSPLKKNYSKLLAMTPGSERDALEKDLTSKMRAGSIDVNIMTKLDRPNFDAKGNPLPDEFSDAKAALRGYAQSSLRSGLVLSAGINQGLFTYMTRFRDFYRDEAGKVAKKIILKVSDFRSALIQGKFLAKKGLEVYEYRIESGLNCGGHAFPTNGSLLPRLLQEVKEKRDLLAKECRNLVQKYYREKGWEFPKSAMESLPLVTVQGGIGTYGEALRMMNDYGMDMTGWATPFLLVPEATCIDETTRQLLIKAQEKDVYVSGASPLGVPFNNLHGTGSELYTLRRIKSGKPGSPCPKGLLASNKEFSEKPLCVASNRYLRAKLKQLEESGSLDEYIKEDLLEKQCICDHLGNGALIALGIVEEKNAPQSICPGPNIAWFNREYTLREMIDHIYGRRPSLVSSERPHMFAKEIVMYVDYFEKLIKHCHYAHRELDALAEYKRNLEDGMDYCLQIAREKPYPYENLASIPPCVEEQRKRLQSIYSSFEAKLKALAAPEPQFAAERN